MRAAAGSMILAAANVVAMEEKCCNSDEDDDDNTSTSSSSCLELYDSSNSRVEMMTRGRRELMSKYFPFKEEEPSPLLCEYFGVALAFAALGAMIRGLNSSTNKAKSANGFSSRKFQRMALQVVLEGAMDRLHCLAQSALDSDKRVKENKNEATAAFLEERKTWEMEKAKLSLKLAEAEAEVGELRMRRGEDAKANEKVALIYASHEQNWKSERKKLRHEIDLLRRDLLRKEVGELCNMSPRGRNTHCEECEAKERHVSALQESLSEKEFFMMTAMEEAQSEEHERNALAAKLAIAESIAAELSEKLSSELADAMRQRVVLQDLKTKQQETERELIKALEEIQNARTELTHIAVVRKEVEDKEEVISAMLRRASREKEEKDLLAKELALSEVKRKHAESLMHRWKSVAAAEEEEGGRRRPRMMTTPHKRTANRFHHRSLGSRSELDDEVLGHSHKRDCSCSAAEEEELQLQPTRAFNEWVELVKSRHAAQLEDKHWREIEAFERQMRAKDERIAAFRSQLLAMELESSKMKSEMEALQIEIENTIQKQQEEENSSKVVVQSPKKEEIQLLGQVMTQEECDSNDNNSNDVELQEPVESWKADVMITNSNLGKPLREKELDEQHPSGLQSIMVNAEIEIQQNDMNLIMVEDGLCQMQYENGRKAKPAEESFAHNSHEKVKVHVDSQDPTSEKAAMDTCLEVTAQTCDLRTDNWTQSGLEVQSRKRLGELVQEEASTVSKSDSLKLQDLLLHEDNTNLMLLSDQTNASKAVNDFPSSELACWLPLDQETTYKFIQPLPDGSQMQGDQGDLALSHSAQIKEQPGQPSSTTLSKLDTKTIKNSNLHTKRRWSSNKQPLRSLSVSDSLTSKTDQTTLDNSSLGQVVHTESLKNSKFDIFRMLKKNTNFDKKQSQHVLLDIGETLQGPPSSKFTGSTVSRNDPQTRAKIQVLSLALEVKRIEQQLAGMNITGASCNTEVEIQPSDVQISRSTRFSTPNKLSRGYAALAGRVSQLAKQIGLTNTGSNLEYPVANQEKEVASIQASVTSELSLQKNPLCKKGSSPLALILLQQRAEAVGENLAAIQSKIANEGGPRSAFDQGPVAPVSPNQQFANTVQAHCPSKVQDILGLQLTHSSSNLEGNSAATELSLQA